MAASITNLLLLTQFQVAENPGSQPAGVTLLSTFNDLDQLLQLTPTTAPPVSMFGVYKTTISSGGYTIDATSLQGTNGSLNATGKKLVAISVKNPTASVGDVNIATGAVNGYAIPQPVKVKPGGFALVYHAAALAAIGSSTKTLDVSGTSGDTPEIGLVLG
ncbi:MAG TPA: hypothetical protein VGN12_10370 [Pirellulales bacterium]|jgi:hypothetical protein